MLVIVRLSVVDLIPDFDIDAVRSVKARSEGASES